MSAAPIFLDDIDLTPRNTMALRCHAMRYIEITAIEQLVPIFTQLAHLQQSYVIVSGGSNVILPPTLDACVISPCLKGRQIQAQTADTIDLEVMAGENWHELVTHTVANGWYGLENLALIPGWVGASPVQNIGAYGVQLEEFVLAVTALHLPTLRWHKLSRADCAFAYRDSLFKQQAGQWLITSVTFRLSKIPQPTMQYGDLAQVATDLAHQHKHPTPTPSDIMQAVIELRQRKLPDPAILANCGSFFKNPIIAKSIAEPLIAKFPKLVYYPTLDPSRVKIAAGWLIDAAGLKGRGVAPIFTHAQQALVLTNHAPRVATQADILKAIHFIQQSVQAQFGIVLEPEPVWIEKNGHVGNPV